MSADDPYEIAARADLALNLLAVDPRGLGGLWLRARSGPVRDRFLARLDGIPLPLRRIHPGVSDEQLFGGIDLSATLSSGQLIESKGILSESCGIVLTMAERTPARLAAHLAGALGRGLGPVIALDEGAADDECPPPAVTEPLGLFVTLDGLSLSDLPDETRPDLAAARARLAHVTRDDAQAAQLVMLAMELGITSLRVPLLACAAARASAALFGHDAVEAEDIARAAGLVYTHRANLTNFSQPEDVERDDPEPKDESEAHAGEEDQRETTVPQEILLEAVRSALPRGLLEQLAAGRAARVQSGASGAGARRKGNRRGRPLPSRPGKLDSQNRIDLVATLRAAAPWQSMRRAASPRGHLVHIRSEDIRVRRFEETSDRLLIFVVDASGSAAMARLAEAKGAIEMLLSEAYARRDHVALIAFRGEGAELLLPPTRSLVQTKRRLAALPGGGGTPLAAGLHCARTIAGQARSRGMTPALALLTDGRANIALDGTANRQRASEDAALLARLTRSDGTASLVIDMSTRPQEALRALSAALDASYVPMPRADAQRLSAAVSAALSD